MTEYFIATPAGAVPVDGWVHHFVGIHSVAPDRWSVTHVPSGHKFGEVHASFGAAKLIVREVAGMADWGAFNGIDGWKNVDPNLPKKVRDFAAECEEFIVSSGKNGSREVAAEVAMRVGA